MDMLIVRAARVAGVILWEAPCDPGGDDQYNASATCPGIVQGGLMGQRKTLNEKQETRYAEAAYYHLHRSVG